ncbi:MAG TPA: CpsD/CapB family tyrosine-protein kinase, partial [Planctomycetota bacterium]|nr:CpsD/CapB family tyrosine-protein kinase [Planctomycetota bacterium]
ATTTERRFDVDQRVITFHKPNDPRAEQFRTIRTALLGLEPLPRTIMITSGSPKEGKSIATANLAASLVEGGRRRVLVVDANFRNPKQTEILAARSRGGLSDVLAGTIQDPRTVVVGTAIPGVDLLPAGADTTNPGALILPKAVAEVLAVLEPSYDFIFVDVPSLEEYADASVISGDVDGVLLVLQIQGPPRRAAEKAVEVLQAARARVLGVIATNSTE